MFVHGTISQWDAFGRKENEKKELVCTGCAIAYCKGFLEGK